jgi:arginine-tRNA-protein transferase
MKEEKTQDHLKVSMDESSLRMEEDEGDHDDVSFQDCHALLTQEDFMTFFPNHSNEQIRTIWKSYISFARFLCDSPFPELSTDPRRLQIDTEGLDTQIPYGCYHQQYHILHGGKEYLFAVGVVDILPSCLSSVYSFFDPELSKKWNLGKITALWEIEWVRRAHIHRPALKYYYLGYYIKSCPKMSYKAEYKPSSLLCPTHLEWIDFSMASHRLETISPVRNICSLAIHPRSLSTTMRPPFDINKDVLIDIDSVNLVSLDMLSDLGRNILYPLVKEFVDEIGEDMAKKCVIKLSQ